jgi:hypothetical protein
VGASKSELWTQLLNSVKIIDKFNAFCVANTPNYLSLEETFVESFVGNHVNQTSAGLQGFRNTLSGLMKSTQPSSRIIIELAKIGYASINTSVSACLDDIYSGMIAATETVSSRAFTFGAVTAGGSNVGSGVVYRLTKDKENLDLEACHAAAGITKIEITKDFASGRTKGNEEGEVYGSGVAKTDELEPGTAPPNSVVLTSKTAADGLIKNAGFESYSGAAPTIDFSDWTLSTAANFDVETTTIARGSAAIEFVDNANILQYLDGVTIDVSKPIFVRVLFNRQAACDGTLTVRLGTQTESVALAAQTGWTALTLGVGTSIKGWYDTYKEDYSGNGIRFQISLASRTTGTLLIDEIIVAQPTAYDGKWYMLVSGATDFSKDDFWTFTDTVANTGRTQYWLSRLYGKYLPHTAGVATYADA